ncbi:MAG: MOSC domain-containing protein, partial [Polyangiaceae bacterium]
SGGLNVEARVAGLFVYPVKSCRAVALDRAVVEARGLRYDRRWMVVDPDGSFVTQRARPDLARVEVAVDPSSGILNLSTREHPTLQLPLVPDDGAARTVRIWDDEVEAIDGGADAARWISLVLGGAASLVFMPERTSRAVSPRYARGADVVSFADAFPILFTATASLADLNARLERGLPMDRFRPNVVVDGGTPWQEDGWRRVRVGRIGVRVVKGCDRCVVTTVDQRTGERGVEPLRTLATFRQREHKVYFGVNGIPEAPGEIAVGDVLTTSD